MTELKCESDQNLTFRLWPSSYRYSESKTDCFALMEFSTTKSLEIKVNPGNTHQRPGTL